MQNTNYETMNVEGGRHVKMWTRGVPVDDGGEDAAREHRAYALRALAPGGDAGRARGKGATVGSVIATQGAIIPARSGVDIGCGMMAVQTSLKASDLPESLAALRSRIERAVPHGSSKVRGRYDRGSWEPRRIGDLALGAR
jgi:tRNA-splicing ligase RtcB